MNYPFDAHGSCTISYENDIVTIISQGPWNKEYFIEMQQQLMAIANQVNIDNYAVLVIPQGEAIAVQDALTIHQEFLKQIHAKGVAIVLSDCLSPATTHSMCEKLYQTVGLNHQFFDNIVDAKHWLQTEVLN